MKIEIVPYDPRWQQIYLSEKQLIGNAVRNVELELHHIGSTSIPDGFAKPIIDILGVVEAIKEMDSQVSILQGLGYQAKGENGINGRLFFQKRNSTGARTHHLHIFPRGAPEVEQHLMFRDFLRTHPDRMAEYSALKWHLANVIAKTRADYVNGKARFINAILAQAQIWSQRNKKPGAFT